MKTLGERIKAIRGMTSQMQFSSSLGIAQTKLSRYERNTTPPDLDFLLKLSRQYSVSLEWLITGEGSKELLMECSNRDNEAPQTTEKDNQLHLLEIVSSLQHALESEKTERRELAAENRRLHQEKEALLREIGELREQVARLEERKNRLAVATDQPAQHSGVA